MSYKRYGKNVLEITGFEELVAALDRAGKKVDVEGRKCFEKCAENVYDALYENAVKAELSESLIEQLDENFTELPGLWRYSVGWKKTNYNPNNLSAWAKVAFYNYGTPVRTTRNGLNRGQETAHPVGSHGFIKKAKLSAARKNRKYQEEALKNILKGLEQ